MDSPHLRPEWTKKYPWPLVGRKVKRGRQVRTIEVAYDDSVPGGVILDDPIDGLRRWNIEELTLLAHP